MEEQMQGNSKTQNTLRKNTQYSKTHIIANTEKKPNTQSIMRHEEQYSKRTKEQSMHYNRANNTAKHITASTRQQIRHYSKRTLKQKHTKQ